MHGRAATSCCRPMAKARTACSWCWRTAWEGMRAANWRAAPPSRASWPKCRRRPPRIAPPPTWGRRSSPAFLKRARMGCACAGRALGHGRHPYGAPPRAADACPRRRWRHSALRLKRRSAMRVTFLAEPASKGARQAAHALERGRGAQGRRSGAPQTRDLQYVRINGTIIGGPVDLPVNQIALVLCWAAPRWRREDQRVIEGLGFT